MVRVEVEVRNQDQWHSTGDVLFRGDAFHCGEYVGNDAAQLFDSVTDPTKFRKRVSELNGPFAVILDTRESVYAAVDHISSVPLFYGLGKETVYLGDNPSWMLKQLPDEQCDTAAATELLLTGYVTGNDTLYPSVKQLQAGQVLSVDRTGTGTPSVTQHYRFTDSEVVNEDRERLFSRFDTVATGVFERLAERADGEPLILALSGGYDSRLVALMLDKIGYENVYAFTFYPDFVTPGDRDIAEEIATELGFEWAPIELTEDDFRELASSGELTSLRRAVEDYSTVKPLPLWMAVMKKLSHSTDFPDSGIVITGHGVAGPTKHLPSAGEGPGQVGLEDTVEWLFSHHYTMRHLDDREVRKMMHDRIKEWMARIVQDESYSVIDAVIRWYWQERTPKFLMRHPDEFGYWGYDRAIPLWDRELAQFWSSVPLEYRHGKELLEKFVSNLTEERIDSPARVAGENSAGETKDALSTLETVVSHFPLESEIRGLYRKWQTRNIKNSEEYVRFGYLSPEQFKRLYPRAQHEKYFHALEKLSRINCDSQVGNPFYEDLRLYERL